MVTASLILFAQTETTFHEPGYFAPAIMGMFLVGAIVSLVAAVLGFRAGQGLRTVSSLVFICGGLLDPVSHTVPGSGVRGADQR